MVFISNIHVWCLAKAPAINCCCDLVPFHSPAWPGVFSQVWHGLHLCAVRDRCLDPWERSFFGITETASDSRGHRGHPPLRPFSAGGDRGGTAEPSSTQCGRQALLSHRGEQDTVLFFLVERFKAQRITDDPRDDLPNMNGCTGRKNDTMARAI